MTTSQPTTRQCQHSTWQTDEIAKGYRAVNKDMVGNIQSCPVCGVMLAFRMTTVMLMPEDRAAPVPEADALAADRG